MRATSLLLLFYLTIGFFSALLAIEEQQLVELRSLLQRKTPHSLRECVLTKEFSSINNEPLLYCAYNMVFQNFGNRLGYYFEVSESLSLSVTSLGYIYAYIGSGLC